MLLLLVALTGGVAAAATPFDHAHTAFGTFLNGAVTPAGVDYPLLASRRSVLDRYLDEVAHADASGFSAPQKLALYVNAYNAYTIRTILDAGLPASIRDLDGGKVWDTRTFTVAGESLTLDQLEHERARALADGRIHAVVNCASKGCPPMPPEPLSATRIDEQLDAATRRWASTNAFRVEGSTVLLSRIFDWYGEDFASEIRGDLPKVDGEPEAALWFLSRYVDDATRQKLVSGTLTAGWMEYDWSLNRAK